MSQGRGASPVTQGMRPALLLQGYPWPSVHLDKLSLKVKLHFYIVRTVQSGFLKVASGALAGGGTVRPQRRVWPRSPPALGACAELTRTALPSAGVVPQETPGRSSRSEPGEEEFGRNFADTVFAHTAFVFKPFVFCKLVNKYFFFFKL